VGNNSLQELQAQPKDKENHVKVSKLIPLKDKLVAVAAPQSKEAKNGYARTGKLISVNEQARRATVEIKTAKGAETIVVPVAHVLEAKNVYDLQYADAKAEFDAAAAQMAAERVRLTAEQRATDAERPRGRTREDGLSPPVGHVRDGFRAVVDSIKAQGHPKAGSKLGTLCNTFRTSGRQSRRGAPQEVMMLVSVADVALIVAKFGPEETKHLRLAIEALPVVAVPTPAALSPPPPVSRVVPTAAAPTLPDFMVPTGEDTSGEPILESIYATAKALDQLGMDGVA